jgi:hypothetical protein
MTVETHVEDDLDVEAWVEAMIAEHGYAQISRHEPGTGLPGFAFTIGLEASRGLPELMVMGVAPDVAAQLFGLCIEGHNAGRCDLRQTDVQMRGLIEGYALQLRPMRAPLVAHANALRPRRPGDIRAMAQLMLPDDTGRFPDELACNLQVAAAQDPDRLLAPAAVS